MCTAVWKCDQSFCKHIVNILTVNFATFCLIYVNPLIEHCASCIHISSVKDKQRNYFTYIKGGGMLRFWNVLVLRTEHVKNFWNVIVTVIVIVVDFFITLPFSTIEGKVIKKLTTMTMTMTFQKFLTKPLLKTIILKRLYY